MERICGIMTKYFLKDLIKYLPAQIVPAIVGLISIPVITRLFNPEDYGNYSLVMATVVVLSTLLSWLPISIIRFYPAYERDNKLGAFYGSIMSLNGISILSLLFFSLLLLLSVKNHISSQVYFLMCIGIGVVAVTGPFALFQHLLRVKRKVNWYSGFAVWKSMGTLGIALFLIFLLKRGIESLLWGAILCVVIVLPILWKKAVEGVSTLHFKIDFSFTKEMARYSFPLVMGNLAAWILSLSDRYILEAFRGAQEVGIYSASYNISDRSIMLITTLFTLASGPILMHIWEKEGEVKSKEFISNVTRCYLMVCVPAVIGLGVLSKPILNILTDAQYFEGYKIIPFVAAGVLILGLQQIFHAGFLFSKRTSSITFAIAASGLLNVFLNMLFIPKYGYFAAAVTTLISYTFLLFLMIILSRRLFTWKFSFKSLAKVTCASAIMGVVVYYVGNSLTFSVFINLISAICVGVIVYLLMLLLLNEFSQEEIQIFNTLKQKVLK